MNLSPKTALDFYKHQATLTIYEAVRGVMILNLNEAHVQAALNNLLKTLQISLNVKTALTDEQAFEVVIEVMCEFPMLTIDEFVYCFRKMKLGHYGTDYNRLDILTIATRLREFAYSNERHTAKKRLENEALRNQFDDAVDMPPNVKEKIKQQIELAANKMKEPIRKGFSQSEYHQQLGEKIICYSFTELKALFDDATAENDSRTIEIIECELEYRKRQLQESQKKI